MKLFHWLLGTLLLIAALARAADPPAEPKIGNRPLSAWVADLDSRDSLICEEAIEVLSQAGIPAKIAVPKLNKLLQSDSPIIRTRAAAALWKIAGQVEPGHTLLLAALRQPNGPNRREAIQILQQMGAKANELAPALVDLLNDTDGELHNHALAALQNYGAASVPAVAQALPKTSGPTRTLLINFLQTLGPLAKVAVPVVRSLLQESDSQTRLAALRVLYQVDEHDRDLVPSLLTLGQSPDLNTRFGVMQLASELNPKPRELEPLFRALLKDTNVALQCQAAAALYETEPKSIEQVMPVLLDALKDRNRRDWAMNAVGRIGPAAKDALPQLINSLKNDPNDGIGYNLTLAHALASLGPSAVGPLFDLLDEPNAYVMNTLLQALAILGPHLGDRLPAALRSNKPVVRRNALSLCARTSPSYTKAAVPALIDIIKGSDKGDRQSAVQVLTQIGPSGRPAVPALIEALKNDQQDACRGFAAKALGNIGPDAKEALSLLRETCKAESRRLRMNSAEAILSIDPEEPSVEPVLFELIRSAKNSGKEPNDIQLVLSVIKQCDVPFERILPALTDFLRNNPDQGSGMSLAWALGSLYPGLPAALPLLEQLLQSQHKTLRNQAAFAICRYRKDGKSAMPVMLEMLKADDPQQRMQVLQGLEQLGSTATEALPLLLERWRTEVDPNLRAQWAAPILAISRTDGEPVLQWLRTQLPRPYMQNQPALRLLCRYDSKNADLQAALRGMTQDRNAYLFNVTIELIGLLKGDGKSFLPKLNEKLKDNDVSKRVRAAFAIYQIEGKAESVLPVLIAALKEEDAVTVNTFARLRTAAALAAAYLGDIGPEARPALPALHEAEFLGDSNLTSQARLAIRKIQKTN
jgi:HEAT repeat protein